MDRQRISDPARVGLIMGGLAVVLVIVVAYCAAFRAEAKPQAKPAAEKQVCFPAAKWNADASYRPCVAVRRVYEDGSFVAGVKDANGITRYTIGVGVPGS